MITQIIPTGRIGCCTDGGQVADTLGNYGNGPDYKTGVSWLFLISLESFNSEKDKLKSSNAQLRTN